MIFDLNDFLRAISQALDFVEEDLFGVPTNHSKRIALIALRISQQMNMSNEEVFDIISMSMLHDNGASLNILHDGLSGSIKEKQSLLESMQEHCIIGEKNINSFPFLTIQANVIKYHHENYDGSGFFGMKNHEVPMMAQIIHLADQLDLNFDLKAMAGNILNREDVIAYVKEHKGTHFSPEVAEAFISLTSQVIFWWELTDEKIDHVLKQGAPCFSTEYTYREIREMTKTFSKIIDAKSEFTQLHSSGLADKLEKMAVYYQLNEDNTQQLLIAADLHDLGKLAVSNKILDKPGSLTQEEFAEVKKHPGVSEICIHEIKGFEAINRWIYQHHEKLDGSGYPRGLTGEALDFESRLLTCMDIYQALREERPYRVAMSHIAVLKVLQDMALNNLVDQQIVNDIDQYCGIDDPLKAD